MGSIYSDANQSVIVAPSGTILTADGVSAVFNNPALSRGMVMVNVSAVSGTSPSLVVGIQAFNPVSGTWFTVTSGAAITAVGDYGFFTGPGSTVQSGISNTIPLPYTWRLAYTLAGTTPSFTLGGIAMSLYR